MADLNKLAEADYRSEQHLEENQKRAGGQEAFWERNLNRQVGGQLCLQNEVLVPAEIAKSLGVVLAACMYF